MSDQNDATAGDTGDHMIPKSRFDQVVQKRRDAEAALQTVLDGMIEDIPEDKRDLVPDLPPAKTIEWLRTAQKKNLFSKNQISNGPDSKRPGGKPPVDFDNMSPQAIMATGYKT